MGTVMLFIGGCFFFPLTGIFVRNVFYKVTKSKLTMEDCRMLSVKCVSSGQAVTAIIVGAFITHSCRHDIMNAKHWLVNSYACFAVPYFFYDIFAMYFVHVDANIKRLKGTSLKKRWLDFIRQNGVMVIHHTLFPVIFFPIIIYFRGEKGDFFVGVLYMVEASTPLVHIRFVLSYFNLTDSLLYVAVGLQMIVVFFISRICVFPYLFWKYAEYSEMSAWRVPFHIPVKCNVGALVFSAVQLYWLLLMLRGANKAIHKMIDRNHNSKSYRHVS